MLNVENRQTSYNQSFGSLLRITQSGRKIDTGFARGYKTMGFVADSLNNFKRPTLSLHYAGSVGQEAITEKMMLKNPLSTVVSLDIDEEAISLGRSGLHSIILNAADDFLIQNLVKPLSFVQSELKRKFHTIFSSAPRPNFVLNNRLEEFGEVELAEHQEKFFQLKPNYREIVQFLDSDVGNILNASKNFKNKANVVYARNFVYQPTENNIKQVIFNAEAPQKVNIEVLDKIANELSEVVKPKGYAVMGDFMGEHIFNAMGHDVEKVSFKKHPLYRRLDLRHQLNSEDLQIFKDSPLEKALFSAGFKPVFYDNMQGYDGIKVPTVWQRR